MRGDKTDRTLSAVMLVCAFAALAIGVVFAAHAFGADQRESTSTEIRLRTQLADARHAEKGWRSRALRGQRTIRNQQRALRDERYGIDHAIRVANHLYGVPTGVLHRCVKGESKYDPNARNPKTVEGQNARGPLQILSPSSPGVRRSTWTDQTSFGAAGWSPFDIYANILGGAQIMAGDARRGKGYTHQWVAC